MSDDTKDAEKAKDAADKQAEADAKDPVKAQVREQKEHPANPRFPGEGNPDFNG